MLHYTGTWALEACPNKKAAQAHSVLEGLLRALAGFHQGFSGFLERSLQVL